MLSENEFMTMMHFLSREKDATGGIPAGNGASAHNGTETVLNLAERGLLQGERLTAAGLEALDPYRIDNAVIMAAGMSSRFVPVSYDTPKALLEVKGEILIERQIRQLQAAGISDITVVTGFMKEKFCYLQEKYGVSIAENDDYYRYNNTSSLMCVADKFANTYLCSADNYFSRNVFEKYAYHAYYPALYADGPTGEYCLSYDGDGRITGVTVGGCDSWYMLGHVYFSRAFSESFIGILRREYGLPQTRDELWEDLYIRHIDELELYIRKYEDGVIFEFDSLRELQEFDESYLDYRGSAAIRFIEERLGCRCRELTGLRPLKDGSGRPSCAFTCRGKEYIYHPEKAGCEARLECCSPE